MHERDRLYRELSTTRGIVAFPSDANFILFRCEARPAAEIWAGLVEAGILIRDFSDLPGCEECLRVSVGTPEHDEKFLETLSQLIHQ
jgi:histidinol-phosphate aminotransferase